MKAYAGVLLALWGLTALTAALAFQDLGAWGEPVALSIAGAKALLVLGVFMHLRGGSRLLWVVASAGFAWVLILLVLTMSDVLTRPRDPGGARPARSGHGTRFRDGPHPAWERAASRK